MKVLQDRRDLAVVLALQICFLIAGFYSGFWSIIADCGDSSVPFVSDGLQITWFVLTASPMLGLLSWAERLVRVRAIYFLLVLATPCFVACYWVLYSAGAVSGVLCDEE